MPAVVRCDYLVVGSGVAGSSCVRKLLEGVCSEAEVCMVSLSPFAKLPVSVNVFSKLLFELKVEEADGVSCFRQHNNFRFFLDGVVSIDDTRKVVLTNSGREIGYDKLIICSGARPRNVFEGAPGVHVLRDVDSVEQLRESLRNSRQVAVVGNGGIAMELAYEIRDCGVFWIVRDENVGGRFFDEHTSAFVADHVRRMGAGVGVDRPDHSTTIPGTPRGALSCGDAKPHLLKPEVRPSAHGCAIGPEWVKNNLLRGVLGSAPDDPLLRHVDVFTNLEVLSVKEVDVENSKRLKLFLSDGTELDCDLVVSATGTVPNTELIMTSGKLLRLNGSGELVVDHRMRTSVADIYAAGDCCFPLLDDAGEELGLRLWFKMNLWSQARDMGAYAAVCAMSESAVLPLCFELFCHVTRFFGLRVCLLGLYNGQGLAPEGVEFVLRSSPSVEFIRLVVLRGRIVGAVLIGETDMEETIENLILSGVDVSHYGADILSPDLDISDFFD